MLRLHLSTELPAQGLQVSIDAAMLSAELRHQPEERVAHPSLLGDGDTGTRALGREFIDPATAEDGVGRGIDAGYEPGRRRALLHDQPHLEPAHLLGPDFPARGIVDPPRLGEVGPGADKGCW